MLSERTSAVIAATALLACTGDERAVARPQTIPIVMNSAAHMQALPRIRLEEEFRIGGSESPADLQFRFVGRGGIGPNNEVYIVDIMDMIVRVFDSTGKRQLQFGRGGKGPGEFENPTLVSATADTIVVLERSRLHVFRADGTLLATTPYAVERRGAELSIWAFEHTPAGWAVAIRKQYDTRRGTASSVHDSLYVTVLDPQTGAQKGALISLPGAETWLLGGNWTRKKFMAAEPTVGLQADGTIYSTPGDEYQITAHSIDGRAVRRIDAEVPYVPVTDAEFRKSLDDDIAELTRDPSGNEQGAGGSYLAVLKREGTKPGHADHRPILGGMLVSREGQLLIHRRDLSPIPMTRSDSMHFDLIGRNGIVVGRLVTSRGVNPCAIAGDKLYAAVHDENDVPQLVRYRMTVR